MEAKAEGQLVQARKLINIAAMHIQEVSTSGIGFELSKPLNILYKELQATRYLLYVYSGAKSIKELEGEFDGLGIAQPSSVKAYINMNKEAT